MEELVRQLDARIAACLATVDQLRQPIAEAESELFRLQSAKAIILRQSSPVRGKTLAMGRNPGSGRPLKANSLREKVASAIEANGPMSYKEISEAISRSGPQTSGLIKHFWFEHVDGLRSKYTLSELGRNRHKVESNIA